MGLKGTRTVLSVILSLIIAASFMTSLVALVLNSTMASSAFVSKQLASDEIVRECERQLSAKFDSLEAESGIPSRVFCNVKKDFSTKEQLRLSAQNLLSQTKASDERRDMSEYFSKLCREYLDGNEIKYKKSDIKIVSDKASAIYRECVDIKSDTDAAQRFSRYKQSCARAMSVGLLIVLLCCVLISVMYRDGMIAYLYMISSFAGGALGTMMFAAVGFITKNSHTLGLTPAVYDSAYITMLQKSFVLMLLAGILFIILSLTAFLILSKAMDKKRKT